MQLRGGANGSIGRAVTRYRKIRVDLPFHAKIRGLTCVERMAMIVGTLSSISGITMVSDHGLARMLGSDVTAAQAARAVAGLVDVGIARHWPEDEILWIVEGCDEQGTQSPTVRRAAAQHASSFGGAVFAAFAERYPWALEYARVAPPHTPQLNSNSNSNSNRGVPDRVPDTLSDRVSDTRKTSKKRGLGKAKKSTVDDAIIVLSHLNSCVSQLSPRARGFGANDANLRQIVRRLEDGCSVDELTRAIDARAAECALHPERLKWLNPSTPFRDGNWPMSQALANDLPPSAIQRTASGYARIGVVPEDGYPDGEIDGDALMRGETKVVK